ncbi:MAG: nucleotidyltransferase domain-containing protein [Planctomycetia bacterium]|nr:nucleotidyltransferase domain-containing protein [Planctomycetia bacterium]
MSITLKSLNAEQLSRLKARLGKEVRALFGEKLSEIFLYGSYARGDFDEESDVDVWVVADIQDSEQKIYRRQVDQLANQLSLEWDVVVSILLVSQEKFARYRSVMPLYKNILREGVPLHVE